VITVRGAVEGPCYEDELGNWTVLELSTRTVKQYTAEEVL
jgi:hypothetical protein